MPTHIQQGIFLEDGNALCTSNNRRLRQPLLSPETRSGKRHQLVSKRAEFGSFLARDATEEQGREALFATRWSQGLGCPKCGHENCFTLRGHKVPAKVNEEIALVGGLSNAQPQRASLPWARAKPWITEVQALNNEAQ